jgi:branched-chain amino acid aminotransferase
LKVWLNGELVDEADAAISPQDRGFLLGDGVFETLRTYGGRLVTLDEHLGRLESGARVLGIEIVDCESLANGARDLVSAAGVDDLRVRITVTSGPGPVGLRRGGSSPTSDASGCTRLITAVPLSGWPETATAVVAPWRHDEHSPLAGVKSTSRADTVLGMVYAREQGADEALFFNQSGNLCEATTANVFAVIDEAVVTPPRLAGCLPGITREHVLRLCRELGIEAAERDLAGGEITGVDELFLTSSTREIQPLVAVDGRPIGTGGAGPVTDRLEAELSKAMKKLAAL